MKIVKADDLSIKDLQENNLIIVGNLAKSNRLREYDDNLLVKLDDNGMLAIDQYGFILETSNNVAFTQASLWNEENVMAVFSSVNKGGKRFVSKKILDNIKHKKFSTDIVVESGNGEIFTRNLEETNLKDEEEVDLYLNFIIKVECQPIKKLIRMTSSQL